MRNAEIVQQVFKRTPAGGRFDTRTITPPETAVMTNAIGKLGIQRQIVVGNDGSITLSASDLTLDTPLETKQHGELSVREAMTLPELQTGQNIRCQTPFRDSSSFAAFLSIGRGGKPFVFDSGEDTTHWLDEQEWHRYQSSSTELMTGNAVANEFQYANFDDLTTNPPPAREWLVPDWFPLGTVVALFSLGGIGKTLFSQQLATHCASGLPLFGLNVLQGPVLGYLCEDDNNELRRRQININAALGLKFSPPSLFLEGRAGKVNTLITFDANTGKPITSDLLQQIDTECEAKRPKLLILDNIAQMYGGQENFRHEVTVFCNALTGLAVKYGCCVLLLGHTSKATGSEYSGSTAWEAAVRTRLWLESKDDGLRELHRKKSNYSGLSSLTMEWQSGCFHYVDGPAGISPQASREAKQAVLAALQDYSRRKITTSHSKNAKNYLPKLMETDGKLRGVRRAHAERALEALIGSNVVLQSQKLGWKSGSRHGVTGLAEAAIQSDKDEGKELN